jgi:hypothetical protein
MARAMKSRASRAGITSPSSALFLLHAGLLLASAFLLEDNDTKHAISRRQQPCRLWPAAAALALVPSLPAVPRLEKSSAYHRHLRRTAAATSSFLLASHRNDIGNDGNRREDADSGSSNSDEEADRLKQRAQELREQIRQMEMQLSSRRQRSPKPERNPEGTNNDEQQDGRLSLCNKRVLVAGANGRLGSMVCRHLLRNYPTTQVVAAVHVVGENSPTNRGYGRLSYEVGAEDGIGALGSAWGAQEQRTATFRYDPETMGEYNLQNLRVVECEFLDPVQCRSVVDGCDAVVWCATDFNGNAPRAVPALSVALLFRAVSRPDKGRVDVEGVQNMLGALKQELQEQRRRRGLQQQPLQEGGGSPAQSSSSLVNFVLISTAPEAYDDYETPFGSFKGIKRQGEALLEDFPSLASTVLQMSRYEDNFVGENLDIYMEEPASSRSSAIEEDDEASSKNQRARRKINRRDAARAAVEALVDERLVGKTVKVWTAT